MLALNTHTYATHARANDATILSIITSLGNTNNEACKIQYNQCTLQCTVCINSQQIRTCGFGQGNTLADEHGYYSHIRQYTQTITVVSCQQERKYHSKASINAISTLGLYVLSYAIKYN